MTVTQPYISYAVQILSQYMHKQKKTHLDITFRLLWYLRGNPGKGVLISKNDCLSLVGFVDADCAMCLATCRSVTWYLVYFENTLVSWKSKKQSTVSRSSTESKYRALGTITCEILWLLKNLKDVKFDKLTPVSVFYGNDSAIKLFLSIVFHEQKKHFQVDIHFIREKVISGILEIFKIDSDFQNADVLTKSLICSQHNFPSNKLSLLVPFSKKMRINYQV